VLLDTVPSAENEWKVMEVGRRGFAHFRVINQNILEALRETTVI